MQAGEREFRYRFWIFFGLFGAAFLCDRIDPVITGLWLLRLLGPGDPDRRAIQILFGIAALIAFIAAALRTWATAYLGTSVVHDGAVRTEGLVADGPYRYVRNPLYLGTQLLMIGMGFLTSRIGALLLIGGGVIVHLRLIGREEAALAATRGESFRAYVARVPRFLPSLTPRVPPAGRAPDWSEGFEGESFFWVIALAVTTFAITLDPRSLMDISLVGGLLYIALNVVMRGRSAARRGS